MYAPLDRSNLHEWTAEANLRLIVVAVTRFDHVALVISRRRSITCNTNISGRLSEGHYHYFRECVTK